MCIFYLSERLDPRRHLKVVFAQLARLGVCTLYPLLEARLMHVLQGAGAHTRRNEWLPRLRLAVADTAHVALCRGEGALRAPVVRQGHVGRVWAQCFLEL